jgi:hypothetical protein
MSEPKSRPWRMFAPLGLVLLLAAGWSAYWFIAMNEIRKGLALAETQLAAEGVTVACAERKFGGYPFRFSFECAKPALAVDTPEQSGGGQAENLKVYIQAWNFRHAIALLEGPTSVSGEASGFKQAFTHGLVRASLTVPSDLEVQAVIDIPELAAQGLGKAAKVVLSGRMLGGKTAEFAAIASTLEIERPGAAPLKLDALDAAASAPLSLLAAPDPLRQASASGETVTVSRVSLKNGPLALQSDGALGVDPAGFLAGTINTTVSNTDQLFAELVKAGAIPPKDAENARAMALLLNGGKPENAAMTFVARGGGLYWGLVKLADLKPLF